MPATVAVLDGTVRVGLEEPELERVAAAGRPHGRRAHATSQRASPTVRSARRRSAGRSRRSARSASARWRPEASAASTAGTKAGRTCRPTCPSSRARRRSSSAPASSPARRPGHARAAPDARRAGARLRDGHDPLFYARGGGPPARPAPTPQQVARIAAVHWASGAPVSSSRARRPELDDVEPLIEQALAAAGKGVDGQRSRRTCSRSSTSGAAVRRSRSTVGSPRTTPCSPSRSPPRSRPAEWPSTRATPTRRRTTSSSPEHWPSGPRESWAAARRPTDVRRRARRVRRAGHVRRGDRGLRGHWRGLGDGGGACGRFQFHPGQPTATSER